MTNQEKLAQFESDIGGPEDLFNVALELQDLGGKEWKAATNTYG